MCMTCGCGKKKGEKGFGEGKGMKAPKAAPKSKMAPKKMGKKK